MGDVLDYERGKLCIGRKVKLNRASGFGHGNGGCVATLKAAYPKYAKVRPAGHGRDELVAWNDVEDWVGGNGSPAPKPARVTPTPTFPLPKPMPVIRRMPELTALEHKELKAMQTPKPTTVPAPTTPTPSAVAALRSAVDSADISNLGSLAEQVEQAKRDLGAARQMVADAKAQEAAAVRVFDDLRASAKKALAMIDAAAGGGA